MANEAEVERMLKIIERGEEKLDELREDRKHLVEANQKLVQLVKKLEVAFEEAKKDKIALAGNEYSFEDGWQPSDIIEDQNLELSVNPDRDEVDQQVAEVIKTMRKIQDLNQGSDK